MALKGQAKTDYQREYMRKRRRKARSNDEAESIRPQAVTVRPKRLDPEQPKPQSYNPMMVGYVPPQETG